MNIHEQREKTVNEIVSEAEKRTAISDAKHQNVQIKIVDGEVYLSAKGLITNFELNSKRKGLSKAEKGIFDRVLHVLREYLEAGSKIVLEEVFTTGDQVVYKGGQFPTDRPKLDPKALYTVEAATNGFFPNPQNPPGDWKICLFLVEFPAPENAPDKRPAFLATLFTHPKEEEAGGNVRGGIGHVVELDHSTAPREGGVIGEGRVVQIDHTIEPNQE